MLSIHGHRLGEQLYDSDQSLVLRSVVEQDARPVVLKVLKDPHPSPARLARFKREYQLLRALDLEGVIKVHEFLRASDHWLFVQEDFGGESLARLGLAGRIELDEFLAIAIETAGHVAAIHEHNIIHKDLNPANIVLERESGAVKLIDFGIATHLSRETVAFEHPSLLEGTPAYLAPEQTGRFNAPVDNRTDLYGLGCTFYELLSGHPPFEAAELVDLLHCHLARPPEELNVRHPGVPSPLAAIIDKLLAKNARDRYQSALGLQADLLECRRQWQQDRRVAYFELGTRDMVPRIAPTTKPHGREREIRTLLAAFERVANGAAELFLVSGSPGIGKSALIKELYQPITARHGFFVSGKFDQSQRDTPYRAVFDAIDALLSQVLMEPPARMQQWAKAIVDATGDMLTPLAEMIPRLELFCERLPPAPNLPAVESNARFHRALIECIRLFTTAEHPLVMFIDDLQWADSASLDLLRLLMTRESSQYLLLLGAYRHNEVPAAHPLRATLHDILASGATLHELELGPLGARDTAALLAESLTCEPAAVEEPARIIQRKTGGNPFFIHTLLSSLASDGVIYFSQELGSWQWRMDRLNELELSDNVVELVLTKLQELPRASRRVLGHAACIGNLFEFGLLLAVSDQPARVVAESLMPALTGSYIIPRTGEYRLLEADVESLHADLDVAYKFAHDRIQQAAYELSSPEARRAVHLRIARAMHARTAGAPADVKLLATVNQFNLARALVVDSDERRVVADLNLAAGRRAKAAAANEAARDYFEHGLMFLGTAPGDHSPRGSLSPQVHARAFGASHRQAVALTEGATEAAHLTGDFAAVERYVEVLLRHAKTNLERVKTTEIRINALTAQNHLTESIASSREILQALGVDLPEEVSESQVEQYFDMVARALGDRAPRDLVGLPDMEDPEALAALHILTKSYQSAFLVHPRLSCVIAATMVMLCLEHGLTDESIEAFTFYGISLCGREYYVLGYEYGCLAETLLDVRGHKSQAPDLAVLGSCFLFHWHRHNRESIEKMRHACHAGGNVVPAANCLHTISAVRFWTGERLSSIDAEYCESKEALETHGQFLFLNWARINHQTVLKLHRPSDEPTTLRGEVYDDVVEMTEQEQHGDQTSTYLVGINKSILAYHFHDYEASLRYSRALGVSNPNQDGSVILPIEVFYRCLALLSLGGDDGPGDEAIEEARAGIERMKRWAELCPANYSHKYHLMAAEHCRVTGEHSGAREHYDRAIDLARASDYTQEEGLALERAALFYLQRDNPRIAGYYMRDAYYAFEHWEAESKLAWLREHYGYLLERDARPRARGARSISAHETSHNTTAVDFGDIDLNTVIDAVRTISRATDVDTLLREVMRVALENAGAERGYMILVRGERLLVKALGELGHDEIFESMSVALDDQEGLSHSVVQYVARTAEPLLLDDAVTHELFGQDPHIVARACRSILCIPLFSRGRMVAIAYLENNRATAVFDEDRLDLLSLLMGPAAVSVESALLNEARTGEFYFRIGGSLPADSPSYVHREADELLARNISQGAFSYVFNTRQMGKSSLRVRTMARLTAAGMACASIDLTSIGSDGITARQWYAGIARALLTGLGLQKSVNLLRWWRQHEELSPVNRLDVLVDEEILERVETPITIFIDEIDAVHGLDFSTDDFFALLRLFYNRRAEDPRYGRLSVVLLGVASPTDLIRDSRRTPFNIGRAIPLAGFRYDEAKVLLPGLLSAGDGPRLLQAVLDWTRGQPFLTQKVCWLIAEDESRPPAGKERRWVASLVRARVIDRWRQHDEPEHFRTIETRMLRASEQVPGFLARYAEILEHGEVDADGSSLESVLLLSGLITRAVDNKVRVGNPIYAEIFDREWIELVTAKASH